MGISREQALDCLQSTDLIGIGMEADAVRRAKHPENVVSYAVDWIVSASDDLLHQIESAETTSIGLAAGLTFAGFEGTLTAIRQSFPAVTMYARSGEEVLKLADAAGMSVADAVMRLRDAGLSSLSSSDLTVDGDTERLLELHRCAHRAGIRLTAGMVFGMGESLRQRVDHLFALRALQEETGGFTAFTLRTAQPASGNRIDAPTAVEYMRTLAVSRIVLDDIENIESNCIAQGLKVVQMALRFGANDAGAISVEGMEGFTEEDLRRVIRDAGFMPVERDGLYQTMYLSN